MYTSTDKGGVSAQASVKLPAINGAFASETGRQIAGRGVNNSVMVTHNPTSSTSQSLIYRSIPPKPHNYTLSDMLGSGIVPPNPVKTKQLGLSGGSPSEFAKRFKSRPTTQPKVIDFSVGRINSEKRRRGINGFFPPVKLRGSAKSHHSTPTVSNEDTSWILRLPTQSTNRLQLIPTAFSEVRPKSTTRSVSRASRQSKMSIPTRKTPESIRTAPAPEVSVPVYPETFECDDLSILPRPKRILPKRDVPWVFRYKVKKNMNELSKIMASRPHQLVDV